MRKRILQRLAAGEEITFLLHPDFNERMVRLTSFRRTLIMPHDLTIFSSSTSMKNLPAISNSFALSELAVGEQIAAACHAWLMKSPSKDTRSNYQRDITQFLQFAGIAAARPDGLINVLPQQIAAWRDQLLTEKLTNASIRRKLTALRSLFSYLQTNGLITKNPAHSDHVDAPAVARDGKTVALTPEDCRRLLNAPSEETLIGLRDRALFAVLAFTGCRVGELTRLTVGSYKMTGYHRVLEIRGKGGKERRVPLHPEANAALERWLDVAGIRTETSGPLFRPVATSRGNGNQGFMLRPLTRRAVQKLVEKHAQRLKLDPNVTVHSLRVTALTTAREQGSDIIDLQDFAGHSDPRTTLMYIRNRDRLAQSPAYVLRY